MPAPLEFKIDRSQRMHHSGLVIRVFQIVGTDAFGWDVNRSIVTQYAAYDSQSAAEAGADDALHQSGHACHSGCYAWRQLG